MYRAMLRDVYGTNQPRSLTYDVGQLSAVAAAQEEGRNNEG